MSSLSAGATHYVVHHQLSEGGMGTVHLGTMLGRAGSRRVALKRIRAEAGGATGERLIAEAQLVFRLTHGNICQVLDLAHSELGTFMVMELVDGVDLKTLLARVPGRRLDPGCAIHIAREVARALDYAHRRTDDAGGSLWLVHGDVKPQNVLLSREGEVKLGDFGVARALGTTAPGNFALGGTPGFMAPEAEVGRSDHRADIYSLGVTLGVALGAREQQDGVDIEALGRGNDVVTRELLDILSRATARRPDDRYSSAAQLEQALSIPFSKIVPPFSASMLARVVDAHAGSSDRLRPAADDAPTLMSLSVFDPVRPSSAEAAPPRREATASALEAGGTRRVERRHRRLPRALIAAVAVLAAGGGWWVMDGRHRASPATSRAAADPAPPTAPPAAAAPVESPPDAGAVAVPPPPARAARTRPPRPRAERREERAGEPAVAAESGFLTVNAYPWGIVYVDGKRVAGQTPAYRVPLPAGSHKVYVFNPDRKQRSPARTVKVRAGEVSTIGFEW